MGAYIELALPLMAGFSGINVTYIFRSNVTPIRRDVGNLIRASGIGIQVDVLASSFDIHRLDIMGIGRT